MAGIAEDRPVALVAEARPGPVVIITAVQVVAQEARARVMRDQTVAAVQGVRQSAGLLQDAPEAQEPIQ